MLKNLITKSCLMVLLLALFLSNVEAQSGMIELDFVVTPPSACDQSDGGIHISALSGAAPFDYSINGGITFQSDNVFTDLNLGTYIVIVRDAENKFSSFQLAKLEVENAPTIEGVVLIGPSECGIGGTLKILASNGVGALQYSIDGGQTFHTNHIFSNVPAGNYNIIVQNEDNSCSVNYPTIPYTPQLSSDNLDILVATENPTCELTNGVIVVRISGGSGDYSYSIDQGMTYQTTNTFENIGAGEYQVIIKDNLTNCQKSFNESVTLIDQDCSTCDLLMLQSSLTLPDCDSGVGQIALNVEGGSGDYELTINGTPYGPTFIYDNLLPGDYTFSVKDRGTDCEKTFSTINLVAPECGCLPTLSTQSITDTVYTCDGIAEVCLDLPIETLSNLEILNNGFPYSGEMSPCGIDTLKSYFYFTMPGQGLEGPYRLERWELNDSIYSGEFQNIDDLINMMNQYDPMANWVRDPAMMMLNGGDAGSKYGSLEITQISTNSSSVFQSNTDFIPVGSKLYLPIGRHQILFKDNNADCEKSIIVDVVCPTCPRIAATAAATITTLFCDKPTVVCFAGADSLSLLEFDITIDGIPYARSIRNCPDITLGFEIELDTGMQEVNFNNSELGCEFNFELDVTCEPTIFVDKTIYVGNTDSICFPSFLMKDDISTIANVCDGEYSNVAFQVNPINQCLIYEGVSEGLDTICISVCDINENCELVVITVTVIDEMIVDTMIVDTMIVDTMIVDTMIVDTMIVDTMIVDTMIVDTMIVDTMIVDTMIVDTMIVDTMIVDTMIVDTMIVDTMIVDTMIVDTMIVDTMIVDTMIVDTMIVDTTIMDNIIKDTILVNETDTLCFTEISVEETLSIKNICETGSSESALFTIDTTNNCLYYTGLEIGIDTACIEICDNLGTCTTTTVVIVVEEVPISTLPPIALDDVDTLVSGGTKILNVLGNDTTNSTLITVTIIENGNLGLATINPDKTITYTSNEDNCDATDSFIYELCNPVGCDTATVTLYIECKTLIFYNGFSPNGDGINETFVIEGIEDFPNNDLKIFNRWGTLVFEQQGYKGQWSGTWNDELLPNGTYFYILNDGEGKQYSGYLQIRR